MKSLEMRLEWKPFDTVGLSRIAQLMNKSNQFNLTTRRYSTTELSELIADRQCLTLQLRLSDQLGDNGMIAELIGRLTTEGPKSITKLADTHRFLYFQF